MNWECHKCQGCANTIIGDEPRSSLPYVRCFRLLRSGTQVMAHAPLVPPESRMPALYSVSSGRAIVRLVGDATIYDVTIA
jgi:hypothetical protein